ncbi:MAG: hypothetical protein H5U40_06965, partial [Polyangiaceae bacterium]|nr:hypothetical protein [Polyangiaceae bacterium]
MNRAARFVGALIVTAAGACGQDDAPVPTSPSANVPAATAPANAGPAAPTSLLDRSGELAPSADGTGGRVGYDLAVGADERVVVELTSTAFDPVLRVQLPDGSSLTNDDYQGSRERSRLELRSGRAGAMKVVVEGYAPDAAGAFRVRVDRLDAETPAFAAAAA